MRKCNALPFMSLYLMLHMLGCSLGVLLVTNSVANNYFYGGNQFTFENFESWDYLSSWVVNFLNCMFKGTKIPMAKSLKGQGSYQSSFFHLDSS